MITNNTWNTISDIFTIMRGFNEMNCALFNDCGFKIWKNKLLPLLEISHNNTNVMKLYPQDMLLCISLTFV